MAKFGELNSHSKDQDTSKKRKIKKLGLSILTFKNVFLFAEEKAKKKNVQKAA